MLRMKVQPFYATQFMAIRLDSNICSFSWMWCVSCCSFSAL